MLISFDSVSVCDGQTHRQTDRQADTPLIAKSRVCISDAQQPTA